jgi:2-polyprenyl-3-methyl-5-hydroxy-6-metoxy-1,4-benzoquinol methylase
MLRSALTGDLIENPIFDSVSGRSITSLSHIIEGSTKVYYDPRIGHLQTTEIANIEKYYDEEYQFFDQSDEDDILYQIVDGKKIFRQQHQVDTLQKKIGFKPGMKVLDYGCGKGTVLKRLHDQRPDVIPYLFDVSEMYVPLWKRFLQPDQYASYEPKEEWNGLFDVVTSFFAFEHTPQPLKELASIKKLIRPQGLIYMIVPNVYENTGDFIVADHVHHYSEISLRYMLWKAGFEVTEIDSASHFGAFIIVARNSDKLLTFNPDRGELERISEQSRSLAGYWGGLQSKINAFEATTGDKRAAIYGAGVYGNFIAASLKGFDKIDAFIDQNPLLTGTTIWEKPILPPTDVPADVEIIYVGLNPRTARSAMESLGLGEGRVTFFYL